MTDVPSTPRFRARITGVVYLLFFLTAVAGELVSHRAGISGFGVSGDDAATANAILANQAAFRLGFGLTLISIALYVAVVALLYRLLEPVSASVALVAAFLGLMGQAMAAFGSLFQLAPLVVLSGGSYLGVFSAQQVQALALLFLNLGAQAGSIGLVFDGFFLLLVGWLVFRSTFLPRILGVLVALAGAAWLTSLAPPLASALATPVEVVGFLAEAALMLWLLVGGVNGRRWTELAAVRG